MPSPVSESLILDQVDFSSNRTTSRSDFNLDQPSHNPPVGLFGLAALSAGILGPLVENHICISSTQEPSLVRPLLNI